jgi:hypothetical protein
MRRCILYAAAVVAGLTVISGGCVNVKVDADGLVRKYVPVSRDDAIRVARIRARDEGLNPDDYKTSARQQEHVWWVWFDEAKPTGRSGWPAHFIVRVDQNGLIEVYKGK